MSNNFLTCEKIKVEPGKGPVWLKGRDYFYVVLVENQNGKDENGIFNYSEFPKQRKNVVGPLLDCYYAVEYTSVKNLLADFPCAFGKSLPKDHPVCNAWQQFLNAWK